MTVFWKKNLIFKWICMGKKRLASLLMKRVLLAIDWFMWINQCMNFPLNGLNVPSVDRKLKQYMLKMRFQIILFNEFTPFASKIWTLFPSLTFWCFLDFFPPNICWALEMLGFGLKMGRFYIFWVTNISVSPEKNEFCWKYDFLSSSNSQNWKLIFNLNELVVLYGLWQDSKKMHLLS